MYGRKDRKIIEAIYAKMTVMQKVIEHMQMQTNELIEREHMKPIANAEPTVDSPFLNSDGLLSVKEYLTKRKGEGKKTDAGTH